MPTVAELTIRYTKTDHAHAGRAPDSYALYLRAMEHAPSMLPLIDQIEAYRATQSAWAEFAIHKAYWRLKTTDGRIYKLHGIYNPAAARERGQGARDHYIGIELRHSDGRGRIGPLAAPQARNVADCCILVICLAITARAVVDNEKLDD